MHVMSHDESISFRNVEQGDRLFLLQLYSSTRVDIRTYASHMSIEEQEIFIEMQFNAQDRHYKKHYPDAEFLIIKWKKKDVGRFYVEEWPSQFRIIDITIDPEYRGRGIGQKVMSLIMAKAEAKDKSTSIHVDKENKAINLYKRLGFVIDGGTEIYHLMTTHPSE